MSKDATVRARMEPEIKAEAEKILSKLGISATQAINMLYKQIILNKGIPFELKVPNATTIAAMNEDRSSLKSFHSVEELFDDLDSGS